MSVLPVLRWPDPRLRIVCDRVDGVDDALRGLVGDMFDTMYDAPGRGLAAPQVGRLVRVFVMDAGWKVGEPTPLAFVNPEIAWRSNELVTGEEGCLSIPGISAKVRRASELRLRWAEVDGTPREGLFTGAEARIVQHEYDHLDGIVTFDRVAPEQRLALEEAYAG